MSYHVKPLPEHWTSEQVELELLVMLHGGPVTCRSATDRLSGHDGSHLDGRTRAGKAWTELGLEVGRAIAAMCDAGVAVRVRTKGDVLFMKMGDAEDLLAEVTSAIAYARKCRET